MSDIHVIGIDGVHIPSHLHPLVAESVGVVAGGRLAELLDEYEKELIAITPLEKAFTRIEQLLAEGDVVVLASGDPLFFGVGKRLIGRFGKERLCFWPALSSMQLAFARYKVPWDDARLISLHGRKCDHIAGLLLATSKSFVFTDRYNSPERIASEILDYLDAIDDTEIKRDGLIHVAENLGMDDERITTGSLQDIAAMKFSDLNVLCLEVPLKKRRSRFGLSEGEICHSRGLITKDEVRAATLHRLCLPSAGIFWDIGGGSGSVSIEGAAINPELSVYCVERRAEELQNIKENIRRFQCYNIVPVAGMAAEVIGSLPDPDVVFIGGSGGEMRSLIGQVAARLGDGGRLVINGVIEKTIVQAPKLMGEFGLNVESSRIEVRRSGPDGPVHFNPISIMVGKK